MNSLEVNQICNYSKIVPLLPYGVLSGTELETFYQMCLIGPGI
jgi:hypothetical protein